MLQCFVIRGGKLCGKSHSGIKLNKNEVSNRVKRHKLITALQIRAVGMDMLKVI
jgi:hypothetical protein